MKFDQIAYVVRDEDAEHRLKCALGLNNKPWVKDQVTTLSQVWDYRAKQFNKAENTALLQFNYDLGIEIELLRYLNGPNFHDNSPLRYMNTFVSHQGAHLDDGERFPDMGLQGYQLIQESRTLSHTAEYLTQPGSPGYGRKYHYQIYELSPGTCLKFIRRIHPQQ